MATDRVAVIRVRMPGKSPASIDMAIVLADPDEKGCEEGQFPDVRPDSGPELVAATGENVLEVGLEPTWQLVAERRGRHGRIGGRRPAIVLRELVSVAKAKPRLVQERAHLPDQPKQRARTLT
jgi:hypothetical protein